MNFRGRRYGYNIYLWYVYRFCNFVNHSLLNIRQKGEIKMKQLKQNTVNDLISFIEREKCKENRTLADRVVQWILEDIISGKCKITGSATDHDKKKMFVEFSYYQENK